MIRQGHVGATEATVLVAVAVAAKAFLSGPAVMAAWAGTAAALALLLNGLLAIGLVSLVIHSLDPQREEGLVEQFERTGGLFGTLLMAAVAFSFLSVTGLGLRELSGQIASGILVRTPVTVTSGAAVLVFSYGAYLGLESIARAAMVFAVPTVAGTFSLFLLALPRLDPSHLTPVFGYGWRSFLTTSLFAGWYREAWLAPILFVYLRDRKRGLSMAVQGVGIGAAVVVLIVGGLLAMFDFPNITRLSFAVLEGARGIYAGEFVSNLESVFVFLFTTGVFLQLTITFWASCLLVADLLHLPEYRPLVPLLGTGVWLLAFLPPSLMSAVHWMYYDLRRMASFFLYPGILLMWVLAILRRRGARRNAV
ncbi:MAG TPA: GerAB/ArcD/ProY family transporter [Firmicutes bacterium]|nr:GerAB/ArcD/ProY family transporter [Bacillota bacterium]